MQAPQATTDPYIVFLRSTALLVASSLLSLAVTNRCTARHLARVDGVGALVVLDGTGPFNGVGLVHERIAVDGERPRRIARVRDRWCCYPADSVAGGGGADASGGGRV